jgi:hypothetical protein
MAGASATRAQLSRTALRESLAARHSEIAQATIVRVSAVENPVESEDAEYIQGFRTAVASAVRFGIDAIESDTPPDIPCAVLNQARAAARAAVDLDVVLRRYVAGYTLLNGFVVTEAIRSGVLTGELEAVTNSQAIALDQLIATVNAEYVRIASERRRTSGSEISERVRRLLAGEPVDVRDLHYDFELLHVGVVARGSEATAALHDVARLLDARLLLVRPDPETCWAWLGVRNRFNAERLDQALTQTWPDKTPLAVGELASGLTGWRLSHRQAEAAISWSARHANLPLRYSEVARAISINQDELLSASLRERYLVPLESARDGGSALRETLRAYLATDRNRSSTAAVLGISRQAVSQRLRAAEMRLGRSLAICGGDLEAALMIDAC